MKQITAVFVQHNRGLFAALTLAAFAAAIIFVGSFSAVDADCGTEETYDIDSYDADAESSDGKGFPNLKLVFKSNDPAKGSILFGEQLVPKPRNVAHVYISLITIGDISLVLTVEKMAFLDIVFPFSIKINPVTPSDGYVPDHLAMNRLQGTTIHFLVSGDSDQTRNIDVYFKEKTK